MAHTLFSILTFVAFAHAIPHAGRQQPASKGKASGLHDTTIAHYPARPSAVIAQMFEWDWVSVAAECTSFLGPAGYGFVQGKINKTVATWTRCNILSVSPAQEHVQGTEWWTDYQPVSYVLTSKRGDRAQYQAMIAACHAAGVKVIAGQSNERGETFSSDR